MAPPEQRRGLVVGLGIGNVVVVVVLSALGWGGMHPLLAHPARAAFVAEMLLLTLIALASPVNLSSGRREALEGRWILVPSVVGVLLLAWLMPYFDRYDRWTFDGDAARWAGVAVMGVGGVLRIWPMFVLGQRFSGLVAIQPDHELVTRGPYRWLRHPSYLGAMVGLVGWALVFRSGVGLVAVALAVHPLLGRIEAEEALLASEFGPAYADYRRRSWRLLPGIY
jgi:protein-S-isoprenylcysteine O-methyltransferase Ste14